MRHSVTEAGVRKGLLQGLSLTMARDIPAFGVPRLLKAALRRQTDVLLTLQLYFSTYNTCRDLLNNYGVQPTMRFPLPSVALLVDEFASSFCSGGVAGVASFVFLHPIDVLKSCRQMQPISTSAQESRAMFIARANYRQEGWRFFTRGIGATVLRAGPVSAVIFCIYEEIMSMFDNTPQ